MQATPCPIHLPSRLASPHPRLQSQVVQSPNPSKKYAKIHRNNVKNYADNSDAKKIPTWPESEDDEEEDPSEDEEEDPADDEEEDPDDDEEEDRDEGRLGGAPR